MASERNIRKAVLFTPAEYERLDSEIQSDFSPEVRKLLLGTGTSRPRRPHPKCDPRLLMEVSRCRSILHLLTESVHAGDMAGDPALTQLLLVRLEALDRQFELLRGLGR